MKSINLLFIPAPCLSRTKCWGEDLNLHALRHQLLRLACLPISPPQHFIRDVYTIPPPTRTANISRQSNISCYIFRTPPIHEIRMDGSLGENESKLSFHPSLPPIAQLVELLPLKEKVVGSNPTGRTERSEGRPVGERGREKQLFSRGGRNGKTVGFPGLHGRKNSCVFIVQLALILAENDDLG